MKIIIFLFMILTTLNAYSEDYFLTYGGSNCDPIITNTDVTHVCFIPTAYYSDTPSSSLSYSIVGSLDGSSDINAYKINNYPGCNNELGTVNLCTIAITCAEGHHLGLGNPVKLAITLVDSNNKPIIWQMATFMHGCMK